MAEMTAAEHAIHVLKLSIQYNNDADPDDCRLALQVIEQQAQTIEKLKCCGNCKHQNYDGMDYGCDIVLKEYYQNKCDKWEGLK